ncbi:alpha/beta fold hydrolase [Actinomadura madurae]|uniref:alpha/beta fold hydrolase n=1 Tax=Actinomadura madurae TaxID=1993 RepID=UPI002027666B|nr:alpha/beta fold hydrolase [Actinomadura madurae]MCP9955516.1 alpha/beta fold hydrolase [Actinomadura madurae]MCP9972254.1 alpha/beta fold hydrolase [Actinomadura madurae]MCP9984759.1 alpha/beta fold hydrolase [Actinomadura madurae]MCQ0003689.1 alpha/beta fold hydrolase [Actinomadura madurae]MCQ0020949.1 alpha/beta fold hydrolase [Actinomadura madurae]
MDAPPPEYVESLDGTPLALYRLGSGRRVVIISGALATAAASLPLAASLAEAGLQGIAYDRRGRGASGDAAAYAPEREVEDLRAILDATADATGGATGAAREGPAAVLGHSAGGALALLAAAAGVPMAHLFLSEPPLRFGRHEPPADLADRLRDLADEGRGEEAVLCFLRENVQLPEAAIAQLRAAHSFGELVALARTTSYDTRLVASVSTPTSKMLGTGVPTTVLRGASTLPLVVTATRRLAAAMPTAELVVVPESRDHRVDPQGTTREILARHPRTAQATSNS